MSIVLCLGAAGAWGSAVAPWLRAAVEAGTGRPIPLWRVLVGAAVAVPAAVWAVPAEPVAVTMALVLAVSGVVGGFVDVAVRRLPDPVTLGCYPVLGAVVIIGGIATGDGSGLLRAAAASAACLVGYAIPAGCGGIGFGDVKLAGLLGLVTGWIGWPAVLLAQVAAFGVGGVLAIGDLFRRKPSGTIPFGPALLAGAWLAILVTGGGVTRPG